MNSFNHISKTLIASALLAIFAVASSTAMAADANFEKKHPRRDQVNDRLQN